MFWRSFFMLMNKNKNNMAHKFRPGQLTQSNNNNNMVLPFCYELALRNVESLASQNEVTTTDSQCKTQSESTTSQSKSSVQTIENNPYYSKYADKIKKAQANKTTTTTTKSEETKTTNSQSVHNNDIKSSTSINPTINDEATTHVKSNKVADSSKVNKVPGNSRKSLNDIVKLDLLVDKSAEEITRIWNEYHSHRDCIYACIPAQTYENFYETSRTYPSFVLPLPRSQQSDAYEFFLLQFEEHSCHFTSLAAYHVHKELAPVCMTIHHYPELSQNKGVVLMMGEFDSDKLSIMECQCLANQLQYYYTTKEPVPKLSLHLFNKEPNSFDHMRLIRHLEEGILSSGTIGSVNLNVQD